MNIQIISKKDDLWLPVAEYAQTCSWDACARMALFIREDKFSDWERVFVAYENGKIMGFCALMKYQAEYTPFIKWVFVQEEYRGRRISQKLLEAAADYAKQIGFDKLFLTTWHIGLYEKYGFVKIGEKEMREEYFEGVYEKQLN